MSCGPDLEVFGGWNVKSIQPDHRCVRTFENRLIDDNWLAKEYLDRILRNPRMMPREIKEDMKDRYEIMVGIRKCMRAKEKALNDVQMLMKRQYGKTIPTELGQPTKFHRFYVCFGALKESFKKTCRPIIGVDGCFLKHACGGMLLCAVGRDGNNHMFPVAWAVVEGERKDSWEWFLNLVSNDLEMGTGANWTVLSDQQKGLIPAIHNIWPDIKHRQCARHIFTNWRKVSKGTELERQFWRCSKASSMGEFDSEIAVLKEMDEQAYEGFMSRDPTTFCKSHFKKHASCDCVDNNMSETFNSFILLARYKPIVSMLEDIRLALMDRMRVKKRFASKFIAGIAPRISEKLKEAYDEQKNCHIISCMKFNQTMDSIFRPCQVAEQLV